jgi:hypothetical protein
MAFIVLVIEKASQETQRHVRNLLITTYKNKVYAGNLNKNQLRSLLSYLDEDAELVAISTIFHTSKNNFTTIEWPQENAPEHMFGTVFPAIKRKK